MTDLRCVAAAIALALGLIAPSAAANEFVDGFAAFQAEDYETAWTVLEPVADSGDRRAQFLMGEMLLKGLGREVDPFEAAGWFQKAVREPDPDRYALYALASQYYNGDGVPTDIPNAVVLYERAASLGDVNAMRSLAAIYARGEGDEVPQDLNAALRWLFTAAQAGDAASGERFDRLAQAAGRTPPFSGRWGAIAYVAPNDHPSWELSPQFLPGLIGGQLALTNGGFTMFGTPCRQPAFIAGETTASALSASLAGAVPYGALAIDDQTPMTSLMVICDGALAATLLRLPDDRLLVSALGGALVFDALPSPTVARAQELLQAAGYNPGPVDGLFGPRTGGALQTFQADAGLVATGAFDATTMFALERAAESASAGDATVGTGE